MTVSTLIITVIVLLLLRTFCRYVADGITRSARASRRRVDAEEKRWGAR